MAFGHLFPWVRGRWMWGTSRGRGSADCAPVAAAPLMAAGATGPLGWAQPGAILAHGARTKDNWFSIKGSDSVIVRYIMHCTAAYCA